MVIDSHVHLTFFKEVCQTEELAETRRNLLAYYKTGRSEINRTIEIMNINGIDKAFLLPFDYSTKYGDLITNDDVKKVVDLSNGAFYGFASIDPDREDALKELEHAFGDLNLSGLKLHPSKQEFYPSDEKMFPIYELCLKYNKPIIFHAGLSWEPNAISEYARPVNFEPIAVKFPKLRICLAHMGFPWLLKQRHYLQSIPICMQIHQHSISIHHWNFIIIFLTKLLIILGSTEEFATRFFLEQILSGGCQEKC